MDQYYEHYQHYEYTIDLDTLKQMGIGYYGRIGMIPYFYDQYVPHYLFTHITTKPYKARGETVKTVHHLIGDFGGGFKRNVTPYEGLVNEVLQEAGEEVGTFLLQQLENSPNVYIHVVQKMNSDQWWVPYNIEILFQIDKDHIPQHFVKTDEVTGIMVVPENELAEKLQEEIPDTKINMGVRLFKEFKGIA